MDKKTQNALSDELKQTIKDIAPEICFRNMYDGSVFELKEGDPKSRIGGVYTYSDYVSVELVKGATIPDPKGILEGKGKQRRHIKLRDSADLKKKACADFLRQAVALA